MNFIALQVVSVGPIVGMVFVSYLLNEELSNSVSDATVDPQMLVLLGYPGSSLLPNAAVKAYLFAPVTTAVGMFDIPC